MMCAKKAVDISYTSADCRKDNIMASPEDNDLLSREITSFVDFSHQNTVSLFFFFPFSVWHCKVTPLRFRSPQAPDQQEWRGTRDRTELSFRQNNHYWLFTNLIVPLQPSKSHPFYFNPGIVQEAVREQ